MTVDRLDHLVLTVRDLDATISFYTSVLGMRATTFGEGRHALEFGSQKINLHVAGREFEPKAAVATPGSADLCFILAGSVDAAIETLAHHTVPVLQGPVIRTGALGPLRSVYFRDPDGNLIEVSEYVDAAASTSSGPVRPASQ
ncbi:MAG: VOC family protein [Fimbriimonadaceae bacterium]|nr:VOC family protein [Fimbriimonadaceae bacterium]